MTTTEITSRNKVEKEPLPTDKKYTYFHKKLGKKMFNNKLFFEDLNKYIEFNKTKEK